jgi:nitrate reductase assembly molybdenum cofactor insertion protein NarJ
MNALLREAAEWRLLGLLLECPNDQWRAALPALAAEVDDPLIASAARMALEEASEGLYHSTFGPGGPAAPREVSYSDSIELGYLMSEIAVYYDAFAYRPTTLEAPDHISVQLGFVAYLRMKQAFAVAEGDNENAETTAQAARRFLKDHLARVAEPLGAGLDASGISYLGETGRALVQRVGPSPKRPLVTGGVFPIWQDDGAIGCPGTETEVEI